MTLQLHISDLLAIAPIGLAAAGMLMCLALQALGPHLRLGQSVIALAALLGAAALEVGAWIAAPPPVPIGQSAGTFGGLLLNDRFAAGFGLVIVLSAALVVLAAPRYLAAAGLPGGEFHALLLAATAGMMLLAQAGSTILIFLGIELLSLALYVLCGLDRRRRSSQESGLKYFLLSSFASAFLLYGFALLYGHFGTTELSKMVDVVTVTLGSLLTRSPQLNPSGLPDEALILGGLALVAVGLAFKVSAVPFHMWTPDVYQGAPTPVTAFMSVGTKAAAFAAFWRLFLGFTLPTYTWYWMVWVMAVLTMVVGNLLAAVQDDLKRLLAYSGVAHAGFVLVALAAGNNLGATAVLFYFAAYAATNLGAFLCLMALPEAAEERLTVAAVAGLFSRRPWLAAALTLCLLSLAGIPPTAGFVAKYLAFAAVVQAGHAELAVVGVVMSVVSAFYYGRVILVMMLPPAALAGTIPGWLAALYVARAPEAAPDAVSAPDGGASAVALRQGSRSLGLAIALAAGLTLLLGVLPNTAVNLAHSAAQGTFPYLGP